MAWEFILSIYNLDWDALTINENNRTIRQNIVSKFSPKINSIKSIKRAEQSKEKQVKVVKIPPPILARLPKEVLEKSKFFNKRGKKANKSEKPMKLYAQASAPSIGETLKLKENFLSLSTKKIENIHRIISDSGKSKSKINMTTKSPLRNQIIILMGNDNKTKFIASSNVYITNINSVLKNIKSNIRTDFVRTDQHGIIIMMNKVTSTSDLQMVENYIKNVDYLDPKDIKILYLPQSKSYLKIIGILYLMENTDIFINSSVVKSILKTTISSRIFHLLQSLELSRYYPSQIWLSFGWTYRMSKVVIRLNILLIGISTLGAISLLSI